MEKDREQCIRCEGRGEVECDCQQDNSPDPSLGLILHSDSHCAACGGTGEHICPGCNGSGYERDEWL